MIRCRSLSFCGNADWTCSEISSRSTLTGTAEERHNPLSSAPQTLLNVMCSLGAEHGRTESHKS